MGEEEPAKSTSQCFPEDNLVPSDVHFISESAWRNDKDSMDVNKFYLSVD